MKALLLASSGAAIIALSSCGPQGTVSENYRSVSQFESQVEVLRFDAENHNLAVGNLSKKGWRLVGESRFESEKKISDNELRAVAVRKRADQIVVSESWEGVKERISVTTLGKAEEATPDLPHRSNYSQRAEIRDGQVQQVEKTRSESWSYRVSFLRKKNQ